MENYKSINRSIESINNIIFESVRHIRDQKRPDIPTIINESTITNRITYLTNTNVLENKRSNNKYLETPNEYVMSMKGKLHLLLIIQILHLKVMIMLTVLLRSKSLI